MIKATITIGLLLLTGCSSDVCDKFNIYMVDGSFDSKGNGKAVVVCVTPADVWEPFLHRCRNVGGHVESRPPHPR